MSENETHSSQYPEDIDAIHPPVSPEQQRAFESTSRKLYQVALKFGAPHPNDTTTLALGISMATPTSGDRQPVRLEIGNEGGALWDDSLADLEFDYDGEKDTEREDDHIKAYSSTAYTFFTDGNIAKSRVYQIHYDNPEREDTSGGEFHGWLTPEETETLGLSIESAEPVEAQ